MTRRNLVWTGAAAAVALSVWKRRSTPAADSPVIVPVHRVIDSRANFTPEQLAHFDSGIWAEAVRDFAGCGIRLEVSEGKGQIRRSPGDRPIFEGVRRGVVNLVVTERIPLHWDRGRGRAGVTTLYEGYHLCLVALEYAHPHQAPFVSVNTCMHELLHAMLQDIFVTQPEWFEVGQRELRIDWYATRAWLFHDGGAIRRSARDYLARLR